MDYPRLLKMLRWPVAFLLLTCMASASWAQGGPDWAEERARLKMTLEDMGPAALARDADATDRAVSYMDLSQLKIRTYNMGIQLGRIFSSGRANFPNADGTQRSYWFTSSVAFGVEAGTWHPTGMVHETSDFHSLSKMDWEAKDGARGIQFSNPPQLDSGYPIYAVSDLPATWPTSGWPAPESVTEVWAGTETWNKWERSGDRNSYCVFDDAYADREGDGQSIPLGIEVKKRTIAYSALNVVFMQYEFTNTSSNNYTGVYIGHVCDKGSPSTNDFSDATMAYYEPDQLIYSVSSNFDPVTGTHTRPTTSEQLAFVGQMVLESPTGSYREENYDPDNPGQNFLTSSIAGMPIEDGTTFEPDNILTRVALLDWGDRQLTDEEGLYGALSGDVSVMDSDKAQVIWKTGVTGLPVLKQTQTDYEAYNGSLGSVDHFYYTASGPFSMAAGASFDFVVAFVGGLTWGQFRDAAATAKHTYNIQFAGPAAPPIPGNFAANGITAGPGGREYDPRIHAYPIHYAPSGNITLSWDLAPSLTTPDPSSGVYDLEGIRLFRSMDRGNTWGAVISDVQGAFANWVPYRQWDKNNGVTGKDGLSYAYLGDDTGLVSSFTDDTALDGIEYWYCIASYDGGEFDPATGQIQLLQSLQTPIGSNPNSPSVIAVVAGSRPNGYVDGESGITGAERLYPDIATASDATVSATVINPADLRDADYRLTTALGGSYGSSTNNPGHFSVTLENITSGQTLYTAMIPDHYDFGADLLPTAEGFKLTVDTDFNNHVFDPEDYIDYTIPAGMSEYDPFYTNTLSDKRGSWVPATYDSDDPNEFVTNFFPVEIHWSAINTQVGYAYERGTDYGFRGTGTFPGQVFDVSDPANPRQVNVLYTVQSSRAAGDNDYAITYPATESTYRSYMSVMADDYDAASTEYVAGTFYTGGTFDYVWHSWVGMDAAFPASGQTVGEYLEGEITTFDILSFVGADGVMDVGTTYDFSMTASSIQDTLIDLDDIKVVPNPYYVYAEWDLSNNRRKIQFTNVPANSEIQIYTLAGELVAILDHHGDATAVAGGRQYNSNRVGTVDWNIWTYEFTEAAYGLYIYVVKTDDGKTKVGKFAIIR